LQDRGVILGDPQEMGIGPVAGADLRVGPAEPDDRERMVFESDQAQRDLTRDRREDDAHEDEADPDGDLPAQAIHTGILIRTIRARQAWRGRNVRVTGSPLVSRLAIGYLRRDPVPDGRRPW